jgi:hypothetical protein
VIDGNCTEVGEADRALLETCTAAPGAVSAPALAAPPRMGRATSVRRPAMAAREKGRFFGVVTRPH